MCGAQRVGPGVVGSAREPGGQAALPRARGALENQPGLNLFQQSVEDLVVEGDRVVGVETQMGLRFHGSAVVLTVVCIFSMPFIPEGDG